MRILVTGPRGWTDEKMVEQVLASIVSKHPGPHTLVHGACKDGLDAIADRVWRRNAPADWPIERHPAKWRRPDGSIDYGAGFARNGHMVERGADVCLAFLMPCEDPKCPRQIPHFTHGTTDCADKADAAGIRVRRFPETKKKRPLLEQPALL